MAREDLSDLLAFLASRRQASSAFSLVVDALRYRA
jgi:hypothetical protein